MGNRRKRFQSPFLPLIFMMVIMMGTIIGKRNSRLPEKGEAADTIIQTNTNTDESMNLTKPPVKEDEDVVIDTRTDALVALDSGVHIVKELDDEYIMSVVQRYCERKVVECSSTKIVRSDDQNTYRQHFEAMTGYMSLVKLSSTEETTFQAKVSSEVTNLATVIVFPDASYAFFETNEEAQFILPKGNSMILYIGDQITGDIEITIMENKCITSKKM